MKRPLVIALCSAGIVLAWLDHQSYAAGQARARERIDRYSLGERYPELDAEIRRRYDPVAADLKVAQALLNDELDRSWIGRLPEERARLELERSATRLEEAAAIGREAWPLRPASWQAPMVLGGATYLSRFRDRDPRFLADREGWEQPLSAALDLAPAQTGPTRFLAAAYLGNWASLDAERRATTVDLLGRAFEDRQTFQLLIRDWLRVAPSRSRALEVIPERPWAWQILQQHFSTANDWELYVRARRRWYETLATDLDLALDEVARQLDGGEQRQARSRLLTLAQGIPRSVDFVPSLRRIIELLPPGPVGSPSAETFAGWLDWSFDLCLRDKCPFDAAATSRLARLAGDLPADQRALAALIAGDLPRAELIERRFATGPHEDWAPYHLLKAEHQTRAHRLEAAESSLANVVSSWRERPRYWIAVHALAAAGDDSERLARTESELERLRRTSWAASAWTRREDGFELEIWPSTAAAGLSLEITGAAPGGSVAEIFLNGKLLEIHRTARSSGIVRIEAPIPSGVSRLAVRFQTGGSVHPGAVQLL